MDSVTFEKVAVALVVAGVDYKKALRVARRVAKRRERAEAWKSLWQRGVITTTQRNNIGNRIAGIIQAFLILEGFNAATVTFQPTQTFIFLIVHTALLPDGELQI